MALKQWGRENGSVFKNYQLRCEQDAEVGSELILLPFEKFLLPEGRAG
jgi:hypothetical protein